MNKNNNLQNALKKAFEDHTEPLHEAQWDRLDVAMGEKKSKRRFLPWMFSIVIIAVILVAAGYWLGQQTNIDKDKTGSNIESAGGSQTGKDKSAIRHDNEKQKSNKTNKANEKTGNDNLAGNNDLNRQDTPQGDAGMVNKAENAAKSIGNNGNDRQSNKYNKGETVNSGVSGRSNKEVAKTGTMDNMDVKNDKLNPESNNEANGSPKYTDEKDNKTGDEKGNLNNEGEKKKTEESAPVKVAIDTDSKDKVSNINDKAKTGSDTSKGKDDDKKKDTEISARKKFAIGFTSGIASVNVKVKSITNNEKLHKDTRSIFEQSNERSNSFYANLSFDWYILKNFNLSFNTGIQYRQINQLVDIAYKYNEIPFKAQDGSIYFYIYIPDSLDPEIYHVKGVNTLNFVNVPIKFGYTVPINAKNEFVLTAGLNVSFLTGAKGSMFSLNTLDFKPLSEGYKSKVNAGLIGGVQFSHNLYKYWWLGLEGIWQQNNYNYNAEYGTIKSKINVMNYSLCLRYKF